MYTVPKLYGRLSFACISKKTLPSGDADIHLYSVTPWNSDGWNIAFTTVLWCPNWREPRPSSYTVPIGSHLVSTNAVVPTVPDYRASRLDKTAYVFLVLVDWSPFLSDVLRYLSWYVLYHAVTLSKCGASCFSPLRYVTERPQINSIKLTIGLGISFALVANGFLGLVFLQWAAARSRMSLLGDRYRTCICFLAILDLVIICLGSH
jgi:hypothetical protein